MKIRYGTLIKLIKEAAESEEHEDERCETCDGTGEVYDPGDEDAGIYPDFHAPCPDCQFTKSSSKTES